MDHDQAPGPLLGHNLGHRDFNCHCLTLRLARSYHSSSAAAGIPAPLNSPLSTHSIFFRKLAAFQTTVTSYTNEYYHSHYIRLNNYRCPFVLIFNLNMYINKSTILGHQDFKDFLSCFISACSCKKVVLKQSVPIKIRQ